MITFLTVLVSVFHPFHVSVCDIEYNTKERRAEVTIKVFLDDMENGLSKMSKEKIDIVKINTADRDSLVHLYLSHHFSLSFGKHNSKSSFLGTEIEKEALWCYLEVNDVQTFNQVVVKNTILLEVFDDQVNLINVSLSGKIKSAKLDASNPSKVISF